MILANHQSLVETEKTEFAFKDVVFLHGLGSNSQMWHEYIKFLNSLGHNCHSLEFRGHGQTPEKFEATDLNVHINDVAESLKYYQINEPFIIIGHSLGAIVGLTMASQNQYNLKTVLAMAMPVKVNQFSATIFDYFLNIAYQPLKKADIAKILPWREKILFQTEHFSLKEILTNIKTIDLLADDFQYNSKIPIHFACADFDLIGHSSHNKKLVDKIPNSSVQVFSMSGHNFMDYKRKEVKNWMYSKLVNI